jgi:peptidoglycan/LPS O-acetylase OafA/YrhL
LTLRVDPPAHGAKQIIGLDAVRFLAAALVMDFHLAFWHSGFGPQNPTTPGLVGFH